MSTIDVVIKDRVVSITLNRPDVLNALNSQTLDEILDLLTPLDTSNDVGCILITGSEKAFAAGADISELESRNYQQMAAEDILGRWERFAALRTPKIAAVSGYALGGGCELAMMCDIIYAAESARFGQPEIKLGLIPGMGGSQRLTRLIGRSRAMDMILTGRFIDAWEAERSGLVARVFPTDALLEEALQTATSIAQFGKSATIAAREAVNRAEHTGLSEGLLFERRTYHSLWATDDAKEGMRAFLEKRKPHFNCRSDEMT
jgi:enoyl-CoA hydratase